MHAVAADDEHVGIDSFLHQQVPRRVRRQHEPNRRGPIGAEYLYENLRQLLAGLLLGLDADRVDRSPGVDRDKGGAQELGLKCRPGEGGIARLRTVNPDDDCSTHNVILLRANQCHAARLCFIYGSRHFIYALFTRPAGYWPAWVISS